MQKLSIKEKFGYSLTDTGINFPFQIMAFFQVFFYTDIFKISASEVATLLLVARIWDAFFDIFIGIVSDRTKTRWGRFRPWLIWTAIPFAVFAILAFTTPNFFHTGKLVYAYLTYILFMMAYSANNIPYSALSGVMTGDMGERTSLSSYRMFFAMVASLFILSLARPMISYFGAENQALGFQITIAIFVGISVICFVTTFFTTKERIEPPPKQKTSIKQDFTDLINNRPWIIMFFATLLIFITLFLRNGVIVYYFDYYLSKESMSAFLNSLNFNSESVNNNPSSYAYSIINSIAQIATIVSLLFAKMLAVRFGKRNVFMTGILLTAIFSIAIFVFPPDAIFGVMVLMILWSFSYGVTIPLLWAMMGDVADYSEWKYERRATGIVFSAIVFSLKAGMGIGGACVGWFLAFYNYVPNAVQSDYTVLGIKNMMSIFPAIPFLLVFVLLFFYRIDKKMEYKLQNELEKRRNLSSI